MIHMTNNCGGCLKLSRELEVLRADQAFELKKLQQDSATFKALFEANLSKDLRKVNEKLTKEIFEREMDNKIWLQKYDAFCIQSQSVLANVKAQAQKDKLNIQNTLKAETQRKLSALNTKLNSQINNLKVSHQKQLQSLNEKYSQEMKNEAQRKSQQIQSLKQYYQQALSSIQNKMDSIVLGVNSQKKAQEERHRKTKIQSEEIQNDLNNKIYQKGKQFAAEQLKNQLLEKNNLILQQRIHCLEQEIKNLKEQHISYTNKMSIQYQSNIKDFQKQNESKTNELLNSHISKCVRYQELLSKIQEHRKQQLAQINSNLKEAQLASQARPSRSEDLQMIQQLQFALNKKEKDFQILSEELRWYRLELENKEETYNKIFLPSAQADFPILKRQKQPKLRRAGKSVTTVRQILYNMQNNLIPLNERKLNGQSNPKTRIL